MTRPHLNPFDVTIGNLCPQPMHRPSRAHIRIALHVYPRQRFHLTPRLSTAIVVAISFVTDTRSTPCA